MKSLFKVILCSWIAHSFQMFPVEYFSARNCIVHCPVYIHIFIYTHYILQIIYMLYIIHALITVHISRTILVYIQYDSKLWNPQNGCSNTKKMHKCPGQSHIIQYQPTLRRGETRRPSSLPGEIWFEGRSVKASRHRSSACRNSDTW